MGRGLTAEDAALVKGMLARGDLQSDIAAYFCVNQGRIIEVKFGRKFRNVEAAPVEKLPERGPYVVVTRTSAARAQVLELFLKQVRATFGSIIEDIEQQLSAARGEGAP